MADDIVKYLRLGRTRFNRNAEAADEIERLRSHCEYWRERCENAEECLRFMNRKKKWWKP